MAATELDFRVMGSRSRILVVGGDDGLAARGHRRLRQLERRWSRFVAGSEVSRLNSEQGVPVLVSADTYRLVERACEGWDSTGGAFDPTVLDAVEAIGYDVSFDLLAPDRPATTSVATVPGCHDIELDPLVSSVTLPVGVRIDPGGVGKGLAADLVATELVASGADGVMVDVGGDLRVLGDSPTNDGWDVGIEHPSAPGPGVARIRLLDGGVATSTTAYHTWTMGGRRVHHLIDPATARPVESSVLSVTVAASDAAWAEMLAKAVFVLGVDDGRRLLEPFGAFASFITGDGILVVDPPFEEMAA
ncbi:MAG: FAD:protein FMN transferase [Acidimicrobiia bacterium]